MCALKLVVNVYSLIILLSAKSSAFAENANKEWFTAILQQLISSGSNRHLAIEETACNGLKLMTSSPAKIEGTFCSPATGRGIRFMSQVTEQGTGRFSIRRLEGEPIVAAERPHDDNSKETLTSILGTHFLVKKQNRFSGEEATEQLIPEAHLQAVKSALYRHEDIAMNNFFDSGVSVQGERLKTFTKLLLRAEVQLIDEAAKAMGMSGISGKDNQAARVFYVYAMRLASAQEKLLTREVSVQTSSYYEDNLKQALFARGNVYENSNANELQQCTNLAVKCPRGKCPIGKDCTGMCGPKCSWCWDYKIVCDDCCFHQGCYDHDLCCSGPKGYMTWGCLSVPFHFKCDHYNC